MRKKNPLFYALRFTFYVSSNRKVESERMIRDQRKFPRLNVRWQINFRVIGSDQFQNELIRQYTTNISRGGICFISDEGIELNAMIALALSSEGASSELLALAKVSRCQRTRRWYEIGAEFWWVGWQNDSAPIANYLASFTKADQYPPARTTSRILKVSLDIVDIRRVEGVETDA